MQKPLLGGFAALTGLLFITSAVSARVMAPAPIPDRVARADCIVVGKVTAIEPNSVASPEGEFQIAVVKVEDPLLNAKGLTHVKVGFHPGANRRFPHLNLKVGQEACFFLTRQAKQTFFTTPYYFDVLPKQDNPGFAKEVALTKRCARLLDDPDTHLKSKFVEERFLATSMLLVRYRTPRPGASGKQEPIEASQSKLILANLAEVDWTKNDPQLRLQPLTLFLRLGLTEKDGWVRPKDFQEMIPAAKKWLKSHADTYRIQRFVADK